MVLNESPLKGKGPRVLPLEASFGGQDAWTMNSGNAYKSLTPNTDSDVSQLSIIFDHELDERLDPIVPKVRNTRESLKSKCPWKIPWVTIASCLLQIIIFSLQTKRIYDLLIYSPYKKNEVWRFFTYCLLHSDVIHLIVNVFLQVLAAFALEFEQGHINVFIVYICGVLAGSLGTSVFQKDLLIIGSSAGVYCLLLSHIPHLVLNFSSLPYRYYRIVSVIVICLNDILLTTLHCVRNSNNQPKIGLAAHISGGLSGLALGFALYGGERSSNLKIVQLFASISFCVFVIVSILLNLK